MVQESLGGWINSSVLFVNEVKVLYLSAVHLFFALFVTLMRQLVWHASVRACSRSLHRPLNHWRPSWNCETLCDHHFSKQSNPLISSPHLQPVNPAQRKRLENKGNINMMNLLVNTVSSLVDCFHYADLIAGGVRDLFYQLYLMG